jgi:hypothetical protein
MPNSTFPAVISFSNKKKTTPVISATYGSDDDEDFGIRMANAVEVQEIDVNLFMSKELWLPVGARGVFGGQVKHDFYIFNLCINVLLTLFLYLYRLLLKLLELLFILCLKNSTSM